MFTPSRRSAPIQASVLYCLLTGFWAVLSDKVLENFNFEPNTFIILQKLNNLGFVILTAGLLYFIVRNLLHRESLKIEEVKKAEALTQLQNSTLEMIAGGRPLPETLAALLRGIEAQSPGRLVSIHLLEGTKLHHCAAPSLPEKFCLNMDWIEIGPAAASAGTAAFRAAPVFVSDIGQDPLWKNYQHLALPHELLACWSTPILDEEKKVLGTFAVYGRQKGLPRQQEIRLIELVTHTAATAIIKNRTEEDLRGSEERFRTLVEQASDLILVHDLEGRLLDVNHSACESLGHSNSELLGMTMADIELGTRRDSAQRIWRSLKPGQSQIRQERYHRKNGTSFPVEVCLTAYEIQGQPVLAALARNISGRKEYEDQLAQSVSLLRATIESSASGLLVVNSEGKITTYNNRFLEMWRIPAELVAQGDDDLILNLVEDQVLEPDQFRQRIQDLYKNPTEESYDTLHFKDGRVFDRVARPQRLGENIIGRVWSFRDITQQTRSEQSIRLQSLALETAANAIMITDFHGNIEWANPAFSQSSGYTLAECFGKNPRELIRTDKQSREFYQEMWATILASRVWHGELTNRRKSGDYYLEEMTITPLHNEKNRITHFVAIKQDITRRRQMEEELRQAAQRTQFYMNRMPLAFIAWDCDFRVTEWNHAAEEIFGWKASEAVGQHAYKLIVPAENQPQVDHVWNEIIRGGNLSSNAINENLTRDGQRITCEWRNTPWRDAAGQISGCLSIVTDITDRLRIEQERENLETQLRQSQKMEAVGQLSGGIAHDFNNILTVVQGNAELLQNLDLSPAEIRDCSYQIGRATERAASLTRQLLMFARKQHMQPVDLDLNEVVAQMIKMLQRILGEQITLRSEKLNLLPLIHADVGMIEQIILNLAINARDAMPGGGQLAIRTHVENFKSAAAPQTQATPHVCLSVTDTGTGIPPEVLPRIFEPFFTTKDVGKGTGLGLATVYGIVQQHRGEISVQSELNRGTTFHIHFPVAPPSNTPKKKEDGARPALSGGTETILLVEDEFPVRTFVSEFLKRLGYRVLEAESGPAALQVWHAHRDEIQLLLTDVIMPENMNGIDLSEVLLQEKPGLKVVYTSGYIGNLEGRTINLTEGVNLIRKPFRPELIAQILRKNLDPQADR